MKRFAFILITSLLLAGCVSQNRQSEFSLLKPWSWRADAAADLQDNQDRLTASEQALVRGAQIEHIKTVTALGAAPESAQVTVARRTADNTDAMLAQAAGPVNVADATEARQMAVGLYSSDAEARENAEGAQARIEAENGRLGEANDKLQAAHAKLAGELSAAYLREREDANFKHKVYWIAGGALVLWLGGNVLSAAARLNPAFSGAAAVANGVISPALAFGYNRAQAGLEKVGHAMHEVQLRAPELADRLTSFMDSALDDDQKRVAAHGRIKLAKAGVV